MSGWSCADYLTVVPGVEQSRAVLTSPAPGTKLAGAAVTFAWTAGGGVLEYWLNMGMAAGGYELYSQSQGTALSVAVSGLPTDGRTLYVRLWSRFAGGWEYNDYTYTAAGIHDRAVLTSPAPGTKLAGAAVTFAWTAGGGVLEYWLNMGMAAGGYELYSQSQGTALSVAVSGLPTDGRTLYVQLWSRFEGGWEYNNYSYTTAIGGTPPGSVTVLTAPSGTIGTITPTYAWNAVATATYYYLWVNDSTGSGKIRQWYTAAQVGCGSGTGNCSITPGIALTPGAATWWVQTWNNAGYGPWSVGQAFTVPALGVPPAVTTLTSPTGTITTTTPTYTWGAVATSTWYYLWVTDSVGIKVQQWYTASSLGCASGTCTITPSTPLTLGAATWWVETWNSAGYGPWSSGLLFTVNPK